MGAGFLTFAAFVLLADLPERLRYEKMGQQAIRQLDQMRRPLLELKTLETQLANAEQPTATMTDIQLAIGSADRDLQRFSQLSTYNPELARRVKRFADSYQAWKSAQQHLLEHARAADPSPGHGLVDQLTRSDELFLASLKALGDCEPPIHADIHKGQQAETELQVAGSLLIGYLMVVFLGFQRATILAAETREKQLDITLQSIGDGVIVTDTAGRVIRMNPLAEALTGWTQTEARGRPVTDVFHISNAETGAQVENPVIRVMREDTVVGLANHTVLTSRDGRRCQVSDSGAPIRDESGRLHGVVLVFRDVSEDYELQAAVREQGLRLQRVLNSAMDAIIIADEQGTILEWNPQAETMFGWKHHDAIGRKLEDLIIPADQRAAHHEAIRHYIKGGKPRILGQRQEFIAVHRDGSEFPIELSLSQLHQSQGWLFCAFIRDLSQQKQTELALSKRTNQLTAAQRIARLGSWELDHRSGRLDWSDEVYRIFELDPATFEPSYERFLQQVHPEDRERFDQAYRESVDQQAPFECRHRLLLPDGRIKHVNERGETIYDAEGEPLYSLGSVQDISDAVAVEEEQQLAATTFNTHAGIMITDRDKNILRVNPALETMTGYSADEVIGKNPRILKSDRQDGNFYRHMWSLIEQTGQWSGELWNKRKDGSLYAEMLTITAVRNDAGEITHYVGTTQDITERKQAENRIEHLAYHDDLTGLANRRLLHDRLQRELAVARRHSDYGAVLFIDLDQFKHLNDALGHPVGDELLRQLAGRFRDIMRREDTVARLGGDEFVFILSAENKDLAHVGFEAQAVADKVLAQVAQPFSLNGHQYHITASVGIVLFPEDDEDADDVLKHADTALYRAKEDGRNTVRFYQPSMQAAADARLTLEKDLREALEQEQFELHYQPQVDLDGQIVGLEALIRWQHPQRGLVPPNTFIPVAEETGLILEIGNWVLRTAARQFQAWQTAGNGHHLQRIAVNVSSRQFQQGHFTDQVISACEEAGLALDFLELEITESMIMSNLGETIEKMTALRARGVRFAIDDFGTGYSSLSYLKRLPLDLLKIDQSFVRDITSDPNDAAIVETIIAITSHLGIGVIAEGVETAEQQDFLRAKGCDSFQGYYYSRPVPAGEIDALLKAGRLQTSRS